MTIGDLATALRRSLTQARSGNPADATRDIQAALQQTADAASSDAGRSSRLAAALRRQRCPKVVAGLARRAVPLDLRVERKALRPDAPDKAAFARRYHDGAHGALDYLLYGPAHRGRPFRGVVLMLHGCTQSREDFAVGTRMNAHAEQNGLVVVYPEQN